MKAREERNDAGSDQRGRGSERFRLVLDGLLLGGFSGFLFFFGLNYFGLIGRDEPRYAQIAREMLARHDWVTPILAGKPWLEKPVFYYWQTMLFYRIFGVHDWAARIASGFDAMLMVIAVYFFLRRFRPGFHLDGALMTASSAGMIGYARGASTDMALAAMFTTGMLGWYGWQESGRRTYLAAFYVLMALATLAKGPVAPFLAGAVVTTFAVATGDVRLIGRTFWVPGILLFGAVGLPWYISVQLRNPEFFRIFILQHNFARFITDVYHHGQPFWYYLPVSLLALAPWTIFSALAVIKTIRMRWKRGGGKLLPEDALNVFLVAWLVVPIIFFSFSQSKLPGYILPAISAGTLLVAEYVRRHFRDESRPPWLMIVLHSIFAALPVLPALMIAHIVLERRLRWVPETVISLAVAAVLAAAMILTLSTKRGYQMLRFVTLVPVVLALAAVLKIGGGALDDTLSARPLAVDINQVEGGLLPAAIFHVPVETEYGLMFYRNQIIQSYDRGEIPAGAHLLIAPERSHPENTKLLTGRRLSRLGTFAPQRLDYFWVSPAEVGEKKAAKGE